MPELRSLLDVLQRDLQHVSAPQPGLTILDRETGLTAGAANPSLPAVVSEPAEPGELVVGFGRRWFRVTGAAARGQQAAEVMSRLQDDVIDSLGRPWPELTVTGSFSGVLEPVEIEGQAVWRSATGFACPLGQLYPVFGHLVSW